VVRLFISSICATLTSVILGLVAGAFIPTEVEADSASTASADPVKIGPYTQQELKAVRSNLDKKLERIRNKEKSQPQIEKYVELRSAAFWVSWLPWLAIPFLLKIRDYRVALTMLGLPSLLTVFKIFLPIELLLFFVVIICSVLALRALSEKSS
jgi:hypothetical protein